MGVCVFTFQRGKFELFSHTAYSHPAHQKIPKICEPEPCGAGMIAAPCPSMHSKGPEKEHRKVTFC